MSSYLVISFVLGVVTATPTYDPTENNVTPSSSYAVPHYGFSYSVSDPHTGDYKAQTEHNDGGVVRGSYSLAEPDGTVRVVEYSAHPVAGFNAVVRRVGPATHPVAYATKKTHIALPALLIDLVNHDSESH